MSSIPPPPPPGGGFPPPPPPGGGYPPPGGGYPPPGGGYPPPGASPYGSASAQNLAEPGPRALAGLVDYFGLLILAIFVQAVIDPILGSLVLLAAVGFGLYNGYLNGATGQSIGKKMQGIKVVSQETGQPIGGGMGVVRALCHIIDNLPCYFGYIFGLFIDKSKQTFADKIIKTVVVKA